MCLYPVPGSMRPGTKRQRIRQVWGWSGEPLPAAPFELNEALNDGVGSTGMFHIHRWREFLFFIRMIEGWRRLPASQRTDLLADPWAFAEWLEEQDEIGTRQLRHILLYLFFPDCFEQLFSNASTKSTIVHTFAKKFGEAPAAFDLQKDRIARSVAGVARD